MDGGSGVTSSPEHTPFRSQVSENSSRQLDDEETQRTEAEITPAPNINHADPITCTVNRSAKSRTEMEQRTQFEEDRVPHTPNPSKSVTSRLFISHFLSSWNSRLFEMGAVLFIAAIFPGTLLPMSVYALVRSGASMLLSPALGYLVDTKNRLHVVRLSIVGQRLAVAASCGIFWLLLDRPEKRRESRIALFAIATLLACVEKLCSISNLISVERDWVVVISGENEVARLKLNARMRRIDLCCKLLGPLTISLVNEASTTIAIWVTFAMSCVSVFIEYVAITAVFRAVPALQRTVGEIRMDAETEYGGSLPSASTPNQSPLRKSISFLRLALARAFPLTSIRFYFQHSAFLPSISLSLLYLTVLSVSGQMITFLLAVGYKSYAVGTTRAVSTVFELSATWIAPRIQRRIGAVRGGIWFLTWQMVCLAVGLSWYFVDYKNHSGSPLFAASGLVGAVILSRVGLWGFDLCAQSIIQEEVDEQARGTFSTVEASFQNLFELLSYLTTIVFPHPDQFRWPVVISVVAVYTAGGTYTAFVRKRRGHLIHLHKCIKPRGENSD